MAPNAETKNSDGTVEEVIPEGTSNADIIKDAGAVHMEPGQPWGRGIVADFKRTVGTHWLSEMTNFNQKTISVSLLMFITVIAPTLTFGAVYSENTENRIGAVETILATCWMGCTFALLSGMPTVIVGSTGPLLIMTTVIYEMAKSIDVPFLPFYAWVSVWAAVYTTLVAFFDLTRFVKLCTKFTDDIFAMIIVMIFILNALGSPVGTGGLLRYLDPNNKYHEDYQEDNPDEEYNYLEVALLSILIGFGTTFTIFMFRGFKVSSYFCNQTSRNLIHDFAVVSSVIIWSIVKQVGFSDVPTQELKVPDQFEPTFQCCDADCTKFFPDECEDQAEADGVRNWFANLGDLNGNNWAVIAAAGPAFLAFILFYLDNGITWHLIYNPSNNLKHGDSYNWDLLLNGLCNMLNGLLGLPWLVATTVPCIVHLNNLSEKDKNGNIIEVQETRLTYLISHGLVGFSLLFLEAVKKIPLPVLLGVFLFMGLASLGGIQFWHRITLFFQQPSKYEDTPYTKYLPTGRIHLFTALQLFFFLVILIVQNIEAVAIIFPFMTLMCIPARLYFLPKIFEGWELLLLDGHQEDIEEWMYKKERMNKTIGFGTGDDDSQSADMMGALSDVGDDDEKVYDE